MASSRRSCRFSRWRRTGAMDVSTSASPTSTFSPPTTPWSRWTIDRASEGIQHDVLGVLMNTTADHVGRSAHGRRGSSQSTGPSPFATAAPRAIRAGCSSTGVRVVSCHHRSDEVCLCRLHWTVQESICTELFCVWYLPCNCLCAANYWKLYCRQIVVEAGKVNCHIQGLMFGICNTIALALLFFFLNVPSCINLLT